MKTKIIIIHESVFSSIIKDTFYFGMIGTLLYANHNWLGNKTIIAVFLMIFAIMAIYARATNRKNKAVSTVYSKKEAIETINKLNIK